VGHTTSANNAPILTARGIPIIAKDHSTLSQISEASCAALTVCGAFSMALDLLNKQTKTLT
jgi:hypothetical protein